MQAADMSPLMVSISEMLAETKDLLIRAEGVALHRLQGRADVLQDFVEAVRSSAETIKKLRSSAHQAHHRSATAHHPGA
jgi:uncharacterized protein YoxC